jgi:hypothetical protein
MRSPLALVKVCQGGEWGWRVAFSATVLRGMRAAAVVLIREPTPGELVAVLDTLPPGAKPLRLETMLLAEQMREMEEQGLL